MAKYGQPDLKVEIENAVASAVNQDVTADVDTLNGADIEALTQQSDVFGDAWVEALYVGVKKLEPLVIEGFYDDAGPLVTTATVHPGTLGEVREVVITWGGTKTTTFDAVISKFNRTPTRNELTRYQLTLSPNGSVVDA